jgi:hypothetical protein
VLPVPSVKREGFGRFSLGDVFEETRGAKGPASGWEEVELPRPIVPAATCETRDLVVGPRLSSRSSVDHAEQAGGRYAR